MTKEEQITFEECVTKWEERSRMLRDQASEAPTADARGRLLQRASEVERCFADLTGEDMYASGG